MIHQFSVLILLLYVVVFVATTTCSAFRLFESNNNKDSPSSSSYTPDPYLQNWMGHLTPIIKDVTMNDISVSGSHDSGTYDLSTTFADDANDLPTWLSPILHNLAGLIDKSKLGPWIRNQAKTQGLTFTQQLDSGLRFIDFRIDYSSPANASSSAQKDWYVMHMMQSNKKALTYLQEMRKWQQEHPSEIVVYWFSHHGTPCSSNSVYANADNQIKQAFWQQVESLFSGSMFDFSSQKLNETTIGSIQQSGQTSIFFIADYQNFTGSSKFATDSCLIDNDLPGDATPQKNVNSMLNRYQNANIRIQGDKKQGKFYLMSGSGPDPKDRMIDALELAFLGHLRLINKTKVQEKCAAIFDVPGSTWCPQRLQECSQWANYYHQIAFEYAIQQQMKDYSAGRSLLGWRFPNAIYIDAVDVNGTIRTGSEVFWPTPSSSSSNSSSTNNTIPTFTSPHLVAKYSYTDTLLLSNVLWICSGGASGSNNNSSKPSSAVCDSFIQTLQARRAKYPFLEWTDLTSGRLNNYPPFPSM